MSSYLKLILIAIFTTISSLITLVLSLIDRSFASYYIFSKIYGKVVLFIAGVKVIAGGLENLERGKPYVFVSNHSSQFDIPAFQAVVPGKVSIVSKKELAKIPLFGWQLRTGPYILIDRKRMDSAKRSIDTAKKMMSGKGVSVLLFAEGTRSKTGEVQPFKRGAFYLASRVGYPIIPVSISGSNRIMPKGKFKIRSGKIIVHFGEPIATDNVNTRAEEIALMENVREIVIKNLREDE